MTMSLPLQFFTFHIVKRKNIDLCSVQSLGYYIRATSSGGLQSETPTVDGSRWFLVQSEIPKGREFH